MTLIQQLLWGSLFLCICLLIESLLLVGCMSILSRRAAWFQRHRALVGNAMVLLISLAFILLAHTIQIWVWATAFVFSATLPDWNTAIYFSLISYTTLGYGDVVLGPGLRIFGGFSAITGVLAFGLSTAFLVAAVGQSLRKTMTIDSGE